MLIILNGVETVHKKWFAGRLVAALNTFEVNGYTIDFNERPFEITDPSGTVVYNAEVNTLLLNAEDGSKNEAGQEIFDRANELDDLHFLTGSRENHYSVMYVDLDYDYGVSSTLTFPPYSLLNNPNVVENYNNRTIENFVISGTFSRGFIEQMITELGRENVKIINIIRNPSVVHLMHEKPPEYYIKNTLYTKEHDKQKLDKSILTSSFLVQFEDVTTVKFEDILRDGYFMFEGQQITLPETHIPYNNWITTFESLEVIPMRNEDLDACLASLSDFNDAFTDLGAVSDNPLYSGNIFEIMGYEPLEFTDITLPNAS